MRISSYTVLVVALPLGNGRTGFYFVPTAQLLLWVWLIECYDLQLCKIGSMHGKLLC